MIKFDKRRLQQVLLNLATNAIKFTKEGTIRIEASIRDVSTDDHKIQEIAISLNDQGIGITEEDMPNIFTPFYRSKSEKSRKMNSRGHGLGLFICRKICQSLGGDLHMQSVVGIGSRFTAIIKAYSVPETDDEILQFLNSDVQLSDIVPAYTGSDSQKNAYGSSGCEYMADCDQQSVSKAFQFNSCFVGS